MQIKKHIPNLITLLNLFCGSIAVILVGYNNFVGAAVFVFLGIFFDFFDGLVARKLNVQSELGLQLDSLADMVTSGLVPGFVMFKMLSLSVDPVAINRATEWSSEEHWMALPFTAIPLIGLLVTLGSAYRLAVFNLDQEQQSYFKGLPTPANALLILSLPLIVEFHGNDTLNALIFNPWFLVGLSVFSAYILNSNIKLFALKFKTYDFAPNAKRYIFLILSVIAIVVFQFIAIPVIILSYVLISLFTKPV